MCGFDNNKVKQPKDEAGEQREPKFAREPSLDMQSDFVLDEQPTTEPEGDPTYGVETVDEDKEDEMTPN